MPHTDPHDAVALWTADQHRLGLKPVRRRVWCRRGQRPQAVVQPRDQGCSLDAVVPPPAGRTFWLLLPTVSIAAFPVALAECAQAVGAGQGKPLLLVGDGAGWQVSPQLQVPAGVQWHVLPPYSPELQPAERLWPLTTEALANRHFTDLDALQTVQAPRGLTLQRMPEVIRAHTHFHGWPQSASRHSHHPDLI